MKKKYILSMALLTLVGCNPFSDRQEQSKEFVRNADELAAKHSAAYKINLRKIKPYTVYRYESTLNDPFRLREFILEKLEEEQEVVVETTPEVDKCELPDCVPPAPHPIELLENYDLSALSFVGTLENQNDVGLVLTPDFGVVPVKVGGYMGKHNGKVLDIKETAIILQEKVHKGGLWKNKKTVLMIKQ